MATCSDGVVLCKLENAHAYASATELQKSPECGCVVLLSYPLRVTCLRFIPNEETRFHGDRGDMQHRIFKLERPILRDG